jgi:hypothetical protein
MNQRAEEMSNRAKYNTPLTDEEIQDVITSFRNIIPINYKIDWNSLELLLREVAHLSHKEWDVTGYNSERLANILLPPPNDHDTNVNVDSTVETRCIFDRILHEGNWDDAKSHAVVTAIGKKKKLAVVKKGGYDNEEEEVETEEQEQSNIIAPWAVLVTGVNGIRKTTSIYQPWFKDVLAEAIVEPSGPSTSITSSSAQLLPPLLTKDQLPTGHNSFFRQLDHIIATFSNVEFATLYTLTAAQMSNNNDDNDDDTPTISKEVITQYSNLKAAIFTRYRTLSELLGVLLLRNAKLNSMNIMCETSGRDVAMFTYIDTFFSESTLSSPSRANDDVRYNKLALHFTINDLSYAKHSVDTRMINEIKAGTVAVTTGQVKDVIYTNMGGPYGSEVLSSVQLDSDRVWNDVLDGEGGGVGIDWYKATMQINAYSDKPWTIQAVKPDGSLGVEYTFENPRVVIK